MINAELNPKKLSFCKSNNDIRFQLSFTKHLFVPRARYGGSGDIIWYKTDICLWPKEIQFHNTLLVELFTMINKDKPIHFSVFSFHEREKLRQTLTASLRTSLFIGKMCSTRTKGKREERISRSSSMSRSRLFTPLLFTLWAVPLSKFGSTRQKMKSPTKSKFSEKGFLL